MSIEFQNENLGSQQINQTNSSGSKMVDFLIKNGIVKDASSANNILIILSLIFIAASVYFFIFGFNLPQKKVAPPQRTLPATELEI